MDNINSIGREHVGARDTFDMLVQVHTSKQVICNNNTTHREAGQSALAPASVHVVCAAETREVGVASEGDSAVSSV